MKIVVKRQETKNKSLLSFTTTNHAQKKSNNDNGNRKQLDIQKTINYYSQIQIKLKLTYKPSGPLFIPSLTLGKSKLSFQILFPFSQNTKAIIRTLLTNTQQENA